ncbi:MAG: radical SAM protein [Candidatus Micrarchaeaceae archaeon]
MGVYRFLKLSATALKSNFSRLEKPFKLTFSITYWCQSRCLTCNIWQIKPKGELSLEEITEFSKNNNFFKWIEITGGEPFMRTDILEIVKVFHENCKNLYVLTMPTNSLCSKEMVLNKIRGMLELGIPRVVITLSLDGYGELHDQIRGVKGNFSKVMEMAKALHEMESSYRNLSFVFGYTMSKYNQGRLMETYKKVKEELGFVTPNMFHINLGQISDIYYRNSGSEIRPENLAASREIAEFIKLRRLSLDPVQIIESAFLKKLSKYALDGKAPMKSRSLDLSLFLDSYGNVYPSIMWGRKIGNIRQTGYDIMPIWNSDDANEVRRLIKEGKEPSAWTSCEAYQTIVGNIGSLLFS